MRTWPRGAPTTITQGRRDKQHIARTVPAMQSPVQRRSTCLSNLEKATWGSRQLARASLRLQQRIAIRLHLRVTPVAFLVPRTCRTLQRLLRQEGCGVVNEHESSFRLLVRKRGTVERERFGDAAQAMVSSHVHRTGVLRAVNIASPRPNPKTRQAGRRPRFQVLTRRPEEAARLEALGGCSEPPNAAMRINSCGFRVEGRVPAGLDLKCVGRLQSAVDRDGSCITEQMAPGVVCRRVVAISSIANDSAGVEAVSRACRGSVGTR
ncbi:hypothetical protein BU26DRAFT_21931 [Trematosphaeria pertusa]|uniref:Uncharacterized protein n=1 Tax=Trematosphaeria pertusa TaxID=390896 RepID=A0A6A6J0R7_9PLEO|nr:uncharacterized protein BU26DRAFT_21931 [Trematosphaeria pertusa]KAF2256435.1 hypothetical protein BU26DRAFT_21931 [Trematosphaeria pertusa]